MYRIPIIKVKNNETGRVHIVGSNSHDSLIIDANGGIQYENLQSCETTEREYIEKETDGYSFEAITDFDRVYIEFVTPEEFFTIIEKDMKQKVKDKTEMDSCLKDTFPKYLAAKQMLFTAGDVIERLKWKMDDDTENEIFQATVTKVTEKDITVATKDFYGIEINFDDIVNWKDFAKETTILS